MLNTLLNLDEQLFLFLNGLHFPILDPVMLFLSDSFIPILLFTLFIIVYGLKKMGKQIFIAFLFGVLAIGFSDGISSHIFKPTFERLRPCKEAHLKPLIYSAEKRCWGGKYGFASSHASNTFAIATFFWLLLRKYNKYWVGLFAYAACVSYSRIYLAKHYPGDIFVGMLIGILSGFFCYKLFLKAYNKISSSSLIN